MTSNRLRQGAVRYATFIRKASTASMALFVCMFGIATALDAAPRRLRHHHVRPAAKVMPATPQATPHESSFYPERVEGGVAGNLPFNNQIRKMVDPLNANGAGR